ncbi:unnamed protein product [Brassica oleracea var. botrytis]|uniref:(rape) hypothetical protein n=1 Tax=Brassica napus TaxID=3708 RepID=A0A816KG71_BRANA|nr:hypothetical protein HID58_048355 [Brassica napus]CAF1918282.1 unnamed protein product [Brassica napus]
MHFLHLNKKRNPSLFPHISRANSLSLRLHFSSVVFAGQSLHGFHRKNLQLSSFMASRVKSIGMHPPKRGGFPARATAGRGGPSFVKNTNPCASPGFPLRRIEELLQAPARRNQPTLHPEKRDGALSISTDDEVKYDIKRAFSNDFDGAWWNLSEVPPEQQDKWWSDFVVVKPHKGRLFGLGTAQMENYDHIAPPAVVLTRQAQLEKEVINLTGMVKLMTSSSLLCVKLEESDSL